MYNVFIPHLQSTLRKHCDQLLKYKGGLIEDSVDDDVTPVEGIYQGGDEEQLLDNSSGEEEVSDDSFGSFDSPMTSPRPAESERPPRPTSPTTPPTTSTEASSPPGGGGTPGGSPPAGAAPSAASSAPAGAAAPAEVNEETTEPSPPRLIDNPLRHPKRTTRNCNPNYKI
ncbi:hypothetical protein JYU34_015191 [Plutella xylostella]|uniref:Uncharacterized protein n=1 Tax=Plutella xylostella TaxID=51655 RepID=A0ABQ7Q6I0_PLUXY|nr:hypothetical protein JYU34_015191 [Plutella xylostella]